MISGGLDSPAGADSHNLQAVSGFDSATRETQSGKALSSLLFCCPAWQGNSKLLCCSTAVDAGDGFAWNAAAGLELAKEDLHNSTAALLT